MSEYCYEYPKPSVTTDCIIIKKIPTIKILLIQRKSDPFAGKWALPGGFVEIDEDLKPGAIRELEEETSLRGIELTQFRTYGTPGRDPRGRTISVVYYGFAGEDVLPEAGDDAAKAQWFDLDDLPHLAFDHAEIIADIKSEMFL